MKINEKMLKRIIKQSIQENLLDIKVKKQIKNLNEYVEKTNNLIEVLNELKGIRLINEKDDDDSDGIPKDVLDKETEDYLKTTRGKVERIRSSLTPTGAENDQPTTGIDADIEFPNVRYPGDSASRMPSNNTYQLSSDLNDEAEDPAKTSLSDTLLGKAKSVLQDDPSSGNRTTVKLDDSAVEVISPIIGTVLDVIIPGSGTISGILAAIVSKSVIKPILEKGLSNMDTLRVIEKIVESGPLKGKRKKVGEDFLRSIEFAKIISVSGEGYSQDAIDKAVQRADELGNAKLELANKAYQYFEDNGITAEEIGQKYLTLSIVNTINQPEIQKIIAVSKNFVTKDAKKRKKAASEIQKILLNAKAGKRGETRNNNSRANTLILNFKNLDPVYQIVASIAVTDIEDDFITDLDVPTISDTRSPENVPLDSDGAPLEGMPYFKDLQPEDIDRLANSEDPKDKATLAALLNQIDMYDQFYDAKGFPRRPPKGQGYSDIDSPGRFGDLGGGNIDSDYFKSDEMQRELSIDSDVAIAASAARIPAARLQSLADNPDYDDPSEWIELDTEEEFTMDELIAIAGDESHPSNKAAISAIKKLDKARRENVIIPEEDPDAVPSEDTFELGSEDEDMSIMQDIKARFAAWKASKK